MENINLLGSEEVQRAGNTIKAAADRMQIAANIMTDAAVRIAQAAETIDGSNHQFLVRYEDLVYRMEQAAENIHEKDKRSIFEMVFGR